METLAFQIKGIEKVERRGIPILFFERRRLLRPERVESINFFIGKSNSIYTARIVHVKDFEEKTLEQRAFSNLEDAYDFSKNKYEEHLAHFRKRFYDGEFSKLEYMFYAMNRIKSIIE